jgi:hypothetical protein
MRTVFQRTLILLFLFAAISSRAENTLVWRTTQDLVSADVKSVETIRVLEGVAKLTGWHVFLESNAMTLNVSAKFKDVSSGEALHLLFPGLNYALVPQTNGPAQLYVFRTSRSAATQEVRPGDLAAKKSGPKKIPNELIVRLKPGMNIDELAKKLGAKVIGKIDGLNAYRLQFSDEAAADAARAELSNNSDVAEVDSNYSVNPPPTATAVNAPGAALPQLKVNPPTDKSGRLTVGIVDTAIQPLGGDLDKFLVKTFSEAGSASPDPNTPTHGTSVYETLLRAASMAENGGAGFQIANADVYGPNSTTSTFDLAAGIADLVNYGAKIINISSGSQGDSSILHDVIQQASKDGVIFYAATGNDGSSQVDYPARYPEVNAVTAGVKPGQLATYANFDPSIVQLMAPGTSLISYGSTAWIFTGTSEASPYIAGLTAGLADSKNASVSTAAHYVAKQPAFQPP